MAVERSTLAQQAYATIRADILDNQFPPGSKLVVRVLTERLGLSPTPIKAALAALEREGFITGIPHRGFFVPVVSHKDMQEIYELREVIDGIAGRNAAALSDRAELCDLLGKLLNKQRSVVKRGRRADFVDLDRQFHRVIWEAAGNGRLLQSVENLLGQIRLGYGGPPREPGRLSIALEEHADILDAICSGDPLRAEHVCRTHVRHAAEAFERNYARNNPEENGEHEK